MSRKLELIELIEQNVQRRMHHFATQTDTESKPIHFGRELWAVWVGIKAPDPQAGGCTSSDLLTLYRQTSTDFH